MAALHSADQAGSSATTPPTTPSPGCPTGALSRTGWVARWPGPSASFALILGDMDNLKAVNDTHGHETGDLALRLLADALRTGLRRSDEAFRIGGDEFAIVLGGAAGSTRSGSRAA